MNKKIFGFIFLNPLFLGIYFLMLHHLYLLCWTGGLEKHLTYIIPLMIIGLLWLMICLIICLFKEHCKDKIISFSLKLKSFFNYLVIIQLVIFIAGTGFYGYKIYQTATSYQGKLAWYIEEKNSTVKVDLKHNQFFETGISGILEDIKKKIEIDDDLYIVNEFQVDFDNHGLILGIEAFIYDYQHTYLLDYQKQDEQMTVWIDNHADKSFKQEKRLDKMIEMTGALLGDNDLMNRIFGVSYFTPGIYSLEYKGYHELTEFNNVYQIDDNNTFKIIDPRNGDLSNAYEISISSNKECIVSLINSTDSIDANHQDTSEEKLVSDGSDMYYHYNKDWTMALKVSDAALGSYFYSFMVNDEIVNNDPFHSDLGVAAGIYFINEKEGMILLTSASKEASSMYLTTNGGQTFDLVTPPVNMTNIELEDEGYQSIDFDYVNQPYSENNKVYINMTRDGSGEGPKLQFEYNDGQWVYVNFIK